MELQLLIGENDVFSQNCWPYGLIQVHLKLEIQFFSVHFSIDINICLTTCTPQLLITVRWVTACIPTILYYYIW